MKIAIFTPLVICLSIFNIETSERKNVATAPKKFAQHSDPQAHLHIKDKKKQTQKRKEARNRMENLKEKGEEHFFYRD